MKMIGLFVLVSALVIVIGFGFFFKSKFFNNETEVVMYFDESKGQDVEETKKQYEALLADKMDKLIEKRKGIESWEVISEEIAEDGMTAKVTTKIVYADGTTNEDKTKMIKTEDGKWLIDSNK